MEEAHTNWMRGAVVLVVVVMAGVALFGLLRGSTPPPASPAPPAPVVAPAQPAPAPAPAIQHPVPEADALGDLSLDDSDAALLDAIG